MTGSASDTEPEFPGAYAAADEASIRWQGRTLTYLRMQLLSGIVGALCGVGAWRWGDTDVDLLAGVATAAFCGGAYFASRLADGLSLRRWYEGRAGAESMKTLSWRYAVGAEPFDILSTERAADSQFVEQSRKVLSGLQTLELPLTGPSRAPITEWMRDLRAASLEQRRSSYLQYRVRDQAAWYRTKAAFHQRRAGRWSHAVVGINVIGIFGSVARFLGFIDLDVLGLFAAGASAATAWTFARQHFPLAAAYSIAEQELVMIGELARTVETDSEWSAFVNDAEEAISREHTLWQASRGTRSA